MPSRTPVTALAVLAVLIASTGAVRPPTPSPTPSPTGSPAPSRAPTAGATRGDGTLQILAYRGYAEYGGSSSKVNWVTTFEEATGCRIARLDLVRTPQELRDAAARRSYDVLSAGPDLLDSLVADRRVQPVDTARVPGYDDLTERLREQAVRGGKTYGVPFLWGFYETVYDATRVGRPRAEQLYTSERAAVRDTPLTLGHAALAFGEDPLELPAAALGRLTEELKAHKRQYWTSTLDIVRGFATGQIDYAQATPYVRSALAKAGEPVKRLATARTTGWVDSWMLGANVSNVDCAYRWLGWTASADTQRAAAAWMGLAPAAPEACEAKKSDKSDKSDKSGEWDRVRMLCGLYGVGRPERLKSVAFPPGDCRSRDGECTDLAAWDRRWKNLVS
ncbi:extracellular solute-binding protein [Thermoactinospora rubra]|uniref:extracellular solute-binding protein n=1 Tax=Thermoactinospora rubra TaxID=1088767 RepID=UPI000A106666|nr:extracellular solute-binding protein [Thermoactinospora rubra]